MQSRKVVITGGPGTGKSSIITELKQSGFTCFDEISRDITLQARQNGIEQLFLTNPLLFSDKLLEGRKRQYFDASGHIEPLVFLDRGIPDILAYMDYIGDSYPKRYEEACIDHTYDTVFILAPWQDIFVSDSERYESFEEAKIIHDRLVDTYRRFQYNLIDVPFDSVTNRAEFVLNTLNLR
ncbi:ATP-binding protein [Winogradskyella sp. DF17]|uniref:ATP-binding protein n=1 Tax=Winogradskyella pelagia TaxID=2819984 RepID=A0ABS3T1F1_9FLAO|nr:ATP-binding protein [Winogradskyella sp. DF17]MBO3116578.1 ATP-binding protein [Winogradskyella sp. DF17]